MKQEYRIERLGKIWFEYVSQDHHKDKDCHWYIETSWSYGKGKKYTAYHYGYIFDGETIECDTYNHALQALIKIMKKAFIAELKYCEGVSKEKEEYDEYKGRQAEWLIKRKLEIMELLAPKKEDE